MNSSIFSHCTLCPHNCGVDRNKGQLGFCKLDSGLHIAKICLHTGEEPIPKSENGVCNVFFSHCNLRCVYCQNYQISQPKSIVNNEITDFSVAVEQITDILSKGVKFVGFVSPSSHIPHMVRIVEMLHEKGLYPKIIYNTNGYDSVESLRAIEDVVDFYIPDFKYAYNDLGMTFSSIPNYSKIALAAIQEMYRQKKDVISEENPALIVRHLVLPNHIANSLEALEQIEQTCSNKVFISLMSQYNPVYKALEISSINRTLQSVEYDMVLDKLDELGFENGWTQLLESNDYYQPDFDKDNPFE
ncbi:MAG: 4Fe-4S cluster-binding domain-containing protein [Bacteroidales bacterium]|nr:4Fe-4S cluster-binding domain-containing protein [Bacteroidales bacterium]